MPNDCLIRRMNVDDLDAVTDIEALSFPRPVGRAVLLHELTENKVARCFVAELNGQVVGYATTWIVIDECEITDIAVSPVARGQGIGTRLLREALQYLSNLGASYCTLEVRVSNLPAQALYRSCGFVKVGVRKKYYEDNGEDALLMLCEHLPEADPDFEEEETVHEE